MPIRRRRSDGLPDESLELMRRYGIGRRRGLEQILAHGRVLHAPGDTVDEIVVDVDEQHRRDHEERETPAIDVRSARVERARKLERQPSRNHDADDQRCGPKFAIARPRAAACPPPCTRTPDIAASEKTAPSENRNRPDASAVPTRRTSRRTESPCSGRGAARAR